MDPKIAIAKKDIPGKLTGKSGVVRIRGGDVVSYDQWNGYLHIAYECPNVMDPVMVETNKGTMFYFSGQDFDKYFRRFV